MIKTVHTSDYYINCIIFKNNLPLCGEIFLEHNRAYSTHSYYIFWKMQRIRCQIRQILSVVMPQKLQEKIPQNCKQSPASHCWGGLAQNWKKKLSSKPTLWLEVEQNSYMLVYIKISRVHNHRPRKLWTGTKHYRVMCWWGNSCSLHQ